MTYQEALAWLYSQLPMYQRIGKSAFKKDLDNIQVLCQRLDNPQNAFRAIHIAGTNGKGSVAHMLASIMQVAGYKTGLYTSPHLKDFRERIKINGKPVSQSFVVDFVRALPGLSEGIQPSFFEITVAMAFAWFAKNQVDIAIIETGLGGRLDSTNIIHPLMSLITSISLDHQDMLGTSLKEIAREKAGIIKPGTPVLVGFQQNSVLEIFSEKARQVNARLQCVQDDYSYRVTREQIDKMEIRINTPKSRKTFLLPFGGSWQAENICLAMEAAHELNAYGFPVDDRLITIGIQLFKENTGFRGRWDILSKNPLVIADGAHNEKALQRLFDDLNRFHFKRLHVVFGTVKDKNHSRILPLLPEKAKYYATQAGIPRAMPAKDLGNLLGNQGREVVFEGTVKKGLQAAKENATEKDLILVTGSLFTVAEAI